MEGSGTTEYYQSLNRLKNRDIAPRATDIDNTITPEAILESGDDEDRWEETAGATITGYVFNVKAGSTEGVNCGATTVAFKDSHIEITLDETDTDATRRFVVETTPK